MDKVEIKEYQNLSEPVRVTVVTGLLNMEGVRVPAGGKEGQNLTKKSDKDYDVYWADPDDINSIEHITLNGEEVPVENKTAKLTVDKSTVGLENIYAELNENIIKNPEKTYLAYQGDVFNTAKSTNFQPTEGVVIDWGDGTTFVCTGTDAPITHNYTDGIDCHLISISGATSIGYYWFSSYDGILHVAMGNTITSIDEGAFAYCSNLTQITIPETVTIIRGSAFTQSGLLNVVIPQSVTEIGSNAFSQTSLQTVTILGNLSKLGNSAFATNNNLTDITVYGNIDALYGSCFRQNVNLTTLNLYGNIGTQEGSILNKGSDFAASYKLQRVIYHGNVDTALDFAIGKDLRQVTFLGTVKTIPNGVFNECPKLQSIYFSDKTPATIGSGNYVYGIFDTVKKIVVPKDAIDAYKSATNWSKYANKIVYELDSNDLRDAGVQSDYSQNDSTSLDYIKNRPFYEEIQENTLLEQTFSTHHPEEEPELNLWETAESQIQLKEGETVNVLFNGTEYALTVKKDYGSVLYIGNLYIFDKDKENTGEPFAVANTALSTLKDGTTVMTEQPQTNATIKVYKSENIIKTIDPKFIQDMYYKTTTETEMFNGNVTMSGSSSGSSGTINQSIVTDIVEGDTIEAVIGADKYYLPVILTGDMILAGIKDTNGAEIQIRANYTDVYTKKEYNGDTSITLKNIHTDIHQIPTEYIPESGYRLNIKVSSTSDEAISTAIKDYLTANAEAFEQLKKVDSFDLVIDMQGMTMKHHFVENTNVPFIRNFERQFVCLYYSNGGFNSHSYLYESTLQFAYTDTVQGVIYKSEKVVYDSNIKFGVSPLKDINDTPYTYGGKLGFYTLDSESGDYYKPQSDLLSLHEWITLAQQRDDFAIPTPTKATDLVDKQYADNNKGGTIPGNVVITGDLTVNGTQHINNTENLNVENAMIYSNAKGATLATNGGIGIKKNATDVYGIVYDPTSDSVKLGLGKSDTNGVFTFNANEGQPVAIRDDSSKFNDNHFIKWNEEHKKLVDSGYLAEDFVDVATQQSIGGIKTFTDEVHFGTTHFSKDLNVDNAILKIFDNQKDLVTQYKSDSIVIENGTGSSAVQYVLTLPKETGTLLLNKFKYSTFGSSNDGDSWNLIDGTKNLEIKYQDVNSHSSIFLEKDYIELSDINGTGSAKISLASNVVTIDTVDSSDKHKIIRVNPDKVSIGNSTDTPLVEIDSLSAKFNNRPQVKNNGNYVDVALKSDLNNYVPTQSESADKYYAQVTNENGIISARIFQNGGDDVQNLTIDKNGVKVLGKNIATTDSLDTKVNKLAESLRNQAYVRDNDGNDTGLAYTYTDEGNTLAVRNASGQLQVSTPSQDNDAANKKFVKDEIANSQGVITDTEIDELFA